MAENQEFSIDIALDKETFIASIDSVLLSISKLEAGFNNLVKSGTQSAGEAKEKLGQVNKELDKGNKEIDKSAKSSADGINKLKNELLALVGVSISVGAIVTGFKNMSSGLRDVGIEAKALGVTAKELDGVQRVFDRYGSSKEEGGSLLSRIAGTRSRLNSGLGLDEFGVSLQKIGALSGSNIDIIGEQDPVVLLKQLSQAMQSAKPEDRLAYSSMLGLSGGALNTLTQQSFSSDIDGAIASSNASDELISLNNTFVEQLKKAQEALKSIGQQIMRAVLPYLIEFNTWLEKWAKWFEDDPDKVAAFFTTLFDGSTSLIDKITTLTGMFGDFETVLAALAAVFVGGTLISVLGGAVKLFAAIASATFNPAVLVALAALGGYKLGEELRETDTGQSIMRTGGDILDTLGSKGLFWASDGTFFTDKWECYEYQEKLNQEAKNNGTSTGGIGTQAHQQAVTDAQSVVQGITAPVGDVSVDWSQVRTWSDDPSRKSESSAFNEKLMRPYISSLEDKHGIPRGMLLNLIRTESAFLPDSRSSVGAMGLGQFMPDTGAEYGLSGDDFYDPKKNLDASAKYLSVLLQWAGGDTRKAAAGYNWGMGKYNNAVKNGGSMPQETLNYIDRVAPDGGHIAFDMETSRMLGNPYISRGGISTASTNSSTQSTVVNGNIIVNNPSQSTVSGVVNDGVKNGAVTLAFGTGGDTMIDFNLSALGGILRGAGVVPSLLSGIKPKTSIIYADGDNAGEKVFSGGSLQELGYKKESNINTAPIEGESGLASSYSSYDKIEIPDTLQLSFIFEGGSEYFGSWAKLSDFSLESIDQVLRTLDEMQKSTHLYNIETLDRMYTGFDLINYSYTKRKEISNSWLYVTMTFQKVNATMSVVYGGQNKKDKSEAASTKTTKGNISEVSLTDQISAVTNKAGEMFGEGVSALKSVSDSITEKLNEVLQ